MKIKIGNRNLGALWAPNSSLLCPFEPFGRIGYSSSWMPQICEGHNNLQTTQQKESLICEKASMETLTD